VVDSLFLSLEPGGLEFVLGALCSILKWDDRAAAVGLRMWAVNALPTFQFIDVVLEGSNVDWVSITSDQRAKASKKNFANL
jgi:hypothetical protein